jgi:hypothetical protein
LWRNNQLSPAQFDIFKNWLADLFIAGDADLKECIVNAILEHLFEEPALLELFKDRKSDKQLAVAYTDALLWIDG